MVKGDEHDLVKQKWRKIEMDILYTRVYSYILVIFDIGCQFVDVWGGENR